ncbi:MAG: hypothetical protein LIO86_14835 [Lachnospiraceae bacterium]|nr:hypothetical protein [Lachnospiraceae bacterium]
MRKYNYQLTSYEAVMLLALLKADEDNTIKRIGNCKDDGDDECLLVAQNRLAETRALYHNLQEQHFNRCKQREATT